MYQILPTQQEKIDLRLRYIWKRQHPSECRGAIFFTLSMPTINEAKAGFGALIRGAIAAPFLGAIYSDRYI